ncbi:MAG TPA: DUF115 domain-containing protein [bacterium]|nr:DUF115 domain-containing protein [bacterium]HQL62377.1 DUF115 domain-containing protein [bacterium]
MELYEKNLQILLRRFPVLARRLQREPDDPHIRAVLDTGTVPNAALFRGGKGHLLHPPDDPVGHARKIIESSDQARVSWNLCIFGIGMGYLPLLLSQREPNPPHQMLLLDPSVHLFRLACQYVDLEPLLDAPGVHFLIGHVSSGEIEQVLYAKRWELIANEMGALVNPATAELFPDWMKRMRSLLDLSWQRLKGSMTTVLLDGPRITGNLAQNLPKYADTPGIGPGCGLLKGKPAIIVAAGPSLKRNLRELKNLRNRALILVCDTALERVLAEGIQPHFVVTVDPSDLNERHFPQTDYSSTGVSLIYDICCHPTIPDRFPGCALTYSARRSPFFEWLDRSCGGKGMIRPGLMVSQTAMNIAAFWGCRPIILVGQDLALDPQTGDTHFDTAAVRRTVRFIRDDHQHAMYPSIDGEEYRKEPIFWVNGVLGEPVPTVRYLLDYLHAMEENVAVLGAPVIDATEGGARIAGTTPVALQEAIYRHAVEKIDIQDFRSTLFKCPLKSDLAPIRREFEGKITALKQATKALFDCMARVDDAGLSWSAETASLIERTSEQLMRDDILEFFVEQVAGSALVDAFRCKSAEIPNENRLDEIRVRCGRLSDALQHTETLLSDLVKSLGTPE